MGFTAVTASTEQASSQGQGQTSPTIAYNYDKAGRLIGSRHGHDAHRYRYDGANRLVQLTHISKLGYTRHAHYRYDGLGRRISKTVSHTDGTTATTHYGWDGDRIVHEETSNQRTTVVYEPGSFVPMLRIDETHALGDSQESQEKQVSAYITDALGTPLQLLSPNGQPRWLAEPDDWAAVTKQRAVRGVTQPIRFQGQWHDEESGLYYNRHRYYDPEQGRYISQDPIGLRGGANLYGYVTNPTGMVDPLGLEGVFAQAGTWVSNTAHSVKENVSRAIDYQAGVIAGSVDFGRNYVDMRAANTIGADKYFHCKANCEAAQRGKGGAIAALCISDAREWFDQHIKGDSASASEADQAANSYGRSGGGENSSEDCSQICEPFRPNGLPSQY